MDNYEEILVGIDGSKQSELAFEKAVGTSVRNKSELLIVSVINGEKFTGKSATTMGYGFVDEAAYAESKQQMEEKLAEYKKSAESAGIEKVSTKVIIGSAKIELGEKIPNEENVDLIILGTTGLNWVGRILVGSTASYVNRVAPCDVLLVRTDTENKEVDIEKTTYPKV